MRRSAFACVIALVSACGGNATLVRAPMHDAHDAVPASTRNAGASRTCETTDEQPFIVDSLPADVTKLDVDFEHAVRFLGYAIEPQHPAPGDTICMRFYWRRDREFASFGWGLFTQLRDVKTHAENLDVEGMLRPRRPTLDDGRDVGTWDLGKIYVEEQHFKLSASIAGEIELLVGVWRGDARYRIVSGPNDGDNRAPVARIKIEATR